MDDTPTLQGAYCLAPSPFVACLPATSLASAYSAPRCTAVESRIVAAPHLAAARRPLCRVPRPACTLPRAGAQRNAPSGGCHENRGIPGGIKLPQA
jgi:hypothetical protein